MPLHSEAPFLVVPSPRGAAHVASGMSSPWFPVVLAAPPGTPRWPAASEHEIDR
jgi:hypothetical protein